MSHPSNSFGLRPSRRLLLLGLPTLMLVPRALVAAPSRPDDVPQARRALRVSSPGDLAQALAGAKPGEHIVLDDGSYPGDLDLSASGTADAPVVLRPRSPGGAKLTGSIRVSGADAVLLGLKLVGATVNLAADGARMSRCRQTGTDGIALLVSNGRRVVIDHNELSDMRGRGISLKPNRRGPEGVDSPHIYRNYLHDFTGPPRENAHEALQVGQGRGHTRIPVKALVEYNLFERVGIDSECISIKSSGNTVRYNTMRDCNSFLSNRHGEDNQIVGNWLERSRGISIQDKDNQVLGNVLVNCESGIRIMGGDVDADEWPAAGTHPAAANTIVSGNQADHVRVGYLFRGQAVPARNTKLMAQGGSVDRESESGTTEAPSSSAVIPKAVRLTPADVGPDAA